MDHNLNEEEQKEYLEFRSKFIKSPEFRNHCYKVTLEDTEHKEIRDFIVVRAPKVFECPTIIFHKQSGLYRGFTLPYEKSVSMLEKSKEQDKDLLSLIWDT